MHGYVYQTTQVSTNAQYVGQRRGGFDPNYFGSGKLLRRAVAKHGPQDFRVVFLQAARDQQELDTIEQTYIREIRELYPKHQVLNIADGGLHTSINGKPFMTGRRHSEETKKRMSERKTGVNNNMFGIRLNGPLNPRFGVKLTDETKRRISEGHAAHRALGLTHGNKGKVRSAETRAKISATKKGRTKTCA